MGVAELLKSVDTLAKRGMNQKQMAKELGFKTTFTLNNRLVKASQITGKSVPPFKQSRRPAFKRIEYVEVKRRGMGNSFGVNIPQEPLTRAGFDVGNKLTVRATRGRIVVTRNAE